MQGNARGTYGSGCKVSGECKGKDRGMHGSGCKLPGECRGMPGERIGVGAKCQGNAGECKGMPEVCIGMCAKCQGTASLVTNRKQPTENPSGNFGLDSGAFLLTTELFERTNQIVAFPITRAAH